jgi:zinc D-Ala-D-Ala carboxypeptidase
VTIVTDPQNPQISAHFYYRDLVITEHRDFIDMNTKEGMQYLGNMQRLCNEILEPIIILLGEVQHVSSCFRCPRLNAVIGGKTNSQHMYAEAADQEFRIHLKDAYNKIMASRIPYSQLIYEFGSWVHVGVTDNALYPGKKRENWISSIVDGKVVYTAVTRAL